MERDNLAAMAQVMRLVKCGRLRGFALVEGNQVLGYVRATCNRQVIRAWGLVERARHDPDAIKDRRFVTALWHEDAYQIVGRTVRVLATGEL